MKVCAAAVAFLLFGWALVAAADARHEVKPAQTAYQVVTMTAAAEEDVWEDTPLADALVDWEQVDRDGWCLWDFMLAHGVEVTLENVITAGDWTDLHGGACAMMEGDDGDVG